MQRGRKSRALHKAQVDVRISRPAENVSPDARRPIARFGSVKEFGAPAREVASGNESIVACVRARTAKISDRPRWAKLRTARRAYTLADQRRPRKSRVRDKDTVDLPSAEHHSHPV